MKKILALAFILAFTTAASAALFGPLFSGSSQVAPPAGHAPVVASNACTVALPVVNATNVNLVGGGSCAYTATCNGIPCNGGDAITGWAITAQSTANSFSITSGGILQGGSAAGSVTTGSYTVTVTASNSTGTSPGVVQSISTFQPPVVASLACTIKSPITNNTNVVLQAGGSCQYTATCGGGACSGANAISGWSVVTDTCVSCYQVTSSGVLQGSTNAATVTNQTDTVTVIATNAGGNSPSVGQTVTAVTVPAITNQNFSAVLPLTSLQTIGTMAASPAPTSWAITAVSGDGASPSDFTISSGGVIQTTSSAPTDITNPGTVTISMTATNATGTSPTGTGTLTLTSPGGSCPKGTSFPDGCPGGPGGTPQFPTLLSGGAYSGQSWSVRPAWNVAAVDYAVATPAQLSTTCGSLTPWKSTSIPNTTISGQNFLLNGATVNCVDFTTSNGAQIVVQSGTNSITASSMIYGPTQQGSGNQSIVVQTGGASLTLNNNVINGHCNVDGGSDTAQSSLVSISAGSTGTLTMEYNLFENFRQHVLEDNANHNIVYNYNMVYNGGSCESGPHLNYLQSGNNNGTQTWTAGFNTTYQPTTPAAGGEGFQAYSNSGSGNGKTVATLNNNTMIYGPSGEGRAHMTTSLGTNCSVGCTTTGSAYGNYIDYRGGVAFYGDPNACPAGTPPQQNTYGAACASGKASNIYPPTGATITTSP